MSFDVQDSDDSLLCKTGIIPQLSVTGLSDASHATLFVS